MEELPPVEEYPMPPVVMCFCGKSFRGKTEYKEGRIALCDPCPSCGSLEKVATVGGRPAIEAVSQEFKSQLRKGVLEDIKRAAEYERWWSAHKKRMGLSSDWVPSHNVIRNKNFVLETLPDIGGDDFIWLCNQIANAVKKVDDNCIDNWRLCYGPRTTQYYKKKRDQGCCGFYDDIVTNPRTGTYFCIGFNYGH